MLESVALARVAKNIGDKVAPVFASAFYDFLSRGGSEVEAIGAAWRKVRSEYVRTDDGGWVKRMTPSDDEDDVKYECSACGACQPRHACRTCGKRGPGVFCSRCSNPMRTGPCPGCRAPWDPDPIERRTDPNAAPGEVAAVIPVEIIEVSDAQVRFAGKGVIRAWASSNTKDQHGSIISQAQILEKIVPGVTLVDEEHNEIVVPGVRIAEVAPAQRSINGVMVDGVSLTIVCDMAHKAARAFYQKFVDQVYRGLSIMFYAPRAVLDAFNRGETDRIDQINRIPLVTATANPSNLGAEVLEIRSMNQAKRSDAQTVPTTTTTTEEPKKPVVENALDRAAAETPTPTKPVDQFNVHSVEVVDIATVVKKALDPVPAAAAEAPVTSSPTATSEAPAETQTIATTPEVAPAAAPPPVSPAQFEELSQRVNSLAAQNTELVALVQSLKDSSPSTEAVAARAGEITASLTKALERTSGVIDQILAQQANILEKLPILFSQERAAARAYTDEMQKRLESAGPRVLHPGELMETAALRAAEETDKALKGLQDQNKKLQQTATNYEMLSRTY